MSKEVLSPPLSESGQEGTKEEFLLKKLEEYDFEEKRKRIC